MANKKILSTKQTVIDEIASKAKESASFVVFNYQGLTVKETDELRNKLRETDSELKVYKNTLTKRALDSLGIDFGDELNGAKAIVFGSDAVAPVKVVSDYAKKHKAIELRIGYIDGKVADQDLLKQYASIPSRDGLLTMFAGGLLENIKNFSICLDLHSQNLEK
jgi:large subunit ribosomal protein L10